MVWSDIGWLRLAGGDSRVVVETVVWKTVFPVETVISVETVVWEAVSWCRQSGDYSAVESLCS